MSKVPELIDALVTQLRAAPGLSDVEVTDGPLVSDSMAPDWVLVGFDGNGDGDFQAAVSEEDWLSLGASRGEEIALQLAIVSSRGDNDVKSARDRVYAIAAPLKDLLRTSPTLGVPQTQAAVGSSTLQQLTTPDGVQARLLLTLVYRTLG